MHSQEKSSSHEIFDFDEICMSRGLERKKTVRLDVRWVY